MKYELRYNQDGNYCIIFGYTDNNELFDIASFNKPGSYSYNHYGLKWWNPASTFGGMLLFDPSWIREMTLLPIIKTAETKLEILEPYLIMHFEDFL